MDIIRNRKMSELFLSQSNYLKKVIRCFKMLDAKDVNTTLGHNTKL